MCSIIDKLFDEDPRYSRLLNYYPGVMHKNDKRGVPFYYENIPKMDPKSLFDACPKEQMIRFHAFVNERNQHE